MRIVEMMKRLLHVRILTWYGVAIYTLIITVAAIIAAVFLLHVLQKEGLPDWGYSRAAMIAAFIAPPLGIFGGYHLLLNTRLADRLNEIVNRDRLTNVSTRDHFFARHSETPDAYGVSLMIDIDHFKSVNDTYGHFVGDEVIQAVARVLKDHTRAKDIVCRFGGEEFVVFLEDAAPEQGWAIAERIREGVAGLEVSTEQQTVAITVSVGASVKKETEDVDAAIRRADACLYTAKESGRNQTVADWRAFDRQGSSFFPSVVAPAI